MMHTPLLPLTKEHQSQDIKLPSRKEKKSLLQRYPKKLSLNDEGCYLAVIAFFFLVINIAMGPSK